MNMVVVVPWYHLILHDNNRKAIVYGGITILYKLSSEKTEIGS
jgi:hypothetical protein